MTEDLLIVGDIMPNHMRKLERRFAVHRYDLAGDREALLADVGGKIRAVMTTGGKGIDTAVLPRLPNLEIIASFGVGLDRIDLDACAARGIWVTNTPDVLNDDVADLGIGLIIASLRRLSQGDDYVRSGRWGTQGPMVFTTTLRGKTLGIIGLGRIGRELALRAKALKMQVAYHGRNRQDVPYAYHATPLDLAHASDVLVLTCPGGAATRNMIGAAELEALGPGGLLVNLARGSVVDENALVAALHSGALGGAALDSYNNEPTISDALRQAPNVLFSPHNASGTVETRTRMSELVVENLDAYFDGLEPPTPVVRGAPIPTGERRQ